MLEKSSHIRKHLQGNPLAFHLGSFATSLKEGGYAGGTMQWKLVVLAGFGRWLRKTGRAVADLDERCADAFVRQKQRVHRGELRTLQHFLDHRQKRNVIPNRNLVPDRSPLVDILNRYETCPWRIVIPGKPQGM